MHTKALFCAALFAGCAHAAGDPADPRAPVPDPHYESVFASYRSVGQIPLADWVRLNAEAGASVAATFEAATQASEAVPDHGSHHH